MKVKKRQVINNQSQIWNVLDDLKEYSEYPDSDFEISFGHGFDYFPPEVEQYRYIFTEEFESNQFTILQKDKKIIYTILRGSLREKKIIFYPDSTVKIVPIYIEDRKLYPNSAR